MKALIKIYLLSTAFISIIVCLILFNFPKSSLAEKWILFYNSQDEEKYYFDQESIEKPDKNIVRVWQRKVMVVNDKEEEVEKTRVEIDCKKNTYKMLKEDSKESKAKPAERIRSTKMQALFENVCYKK
ncbi:MAG TPA: hypothetical protein PLM71_02765 [Syntrophorhabdaceae bacterium]|nr:hypothetical protein [Syntrophorhabdaceae bacterium]HPU29228.1 hypothetical protein [Syntrophorhabdaceae bacterium]